MKIAEIWQVAADDLGNRREGEQTEGLAQIHPAIVA